MTKHVDHTLIQADILLPLDQSDAVRVNLGDRTTGNGVQAAGSMWGTDGFVSVPDAPDANGTCQAYYYQDGNEKAVIARKDHRLDAKMGNLPSTPGTKGIINSSAGRFILKKDGSIMNYTTDDNTDNGRGIYVETTPTGIALVTPWCRVTIGPMGFHVLHTSGARIDLGSVGGLPSPFDALASYARMEAGLVSVKGSAVSLGTDGGAASEIAVTVAITFLSQIIQAISLITAGTPGAAALSTAGLPPNAAAVVTLLTPLLAPIGKVA